MVLPDRSVESSAASQRESSPPLAMHLRGAIWQLVLLFTSLALWEFFCQTPVIAELSRWPRILISGAGHFIIVSASATICVRFVSLLHQQIAWNRDLNRRLADEQAQAR